MFDHGQFRILQLLIGGILTVVALAAGSTCSLGVDSRHLLDKLGGAQFQLLRWSHPRSPFYAQGLSLAEQFKHAVQRSRERRAALSSGTNDVTFVSPLRNLQTIYAMEINIGTPPQKFTAIADTGSGFVWISCLPCSDCTATMDPLFDHTKSSSYNRLSCSDPFCTTRYAAPCSSPNETCQYLDTYASGESTSGELARETITLNTTTGNTNTVSDFVFGCAQKTHGYYWNVDGIVGLNRDRLSFTTQLGSLHGNKFSYCLVSFYDKFNQTSPLLFGHSSIPKVMTHYTPFQENPNPNYTAYYWIRLMGIKVEGVALNITSDAFDFNPDGSGGMISDSGTEFTYLVDVAYNPLLSTMQSQIIEYPVIPGGLNWTVGSGSETSTLGFDLCYNLSGVPSPKFPNVTMVFENMDLNLPQDNVFIRIPGYNDTACMAFGNSGPNGTIPGSIFGGIQQQNFQILHDLEENRFGFAKVQCDALSSGCSSGTCNTAKAHQAAVHRVTKPNNGVGNA